MEDEEEKKLEGLLTDIRTVVNALSDVLSSNVDISGEDFPRRTLKSLFERGAWIERLFADKTGNGQMNPLRDLIERKLGSEVCCSKICDYLLLRFVRSGHPGVVYDAIAYHSKTCGRHRTVDLLRSTVSTRMAFKKMSGSCVEKFSAGEIVKIEASMIADNWSSSWDTRREALEKKAEELSGNVELCLAVMADGKIRPSIVEMLADKLGRKLESRFNRETGDGLLKNREILRDVLTSSPGFARSVFALLKSAESNLRYCGSWIADGDGCLSYDQLVDTVDLMMMESTSNLGLRTKAFIELAKRKHYSLWTSVENDVASRKRDPVQWRPNSSLEKNKLNENSR